MVAIIEKNKKVSKEERIISIILAIAIFVVSITGCILGNIFTSDEASAVIVVMYFVAVICIVAAWITTTISLRNR